jgi:hypothetical protein
MNSFSVNDYSWGTVCDDGISNNEASAICSYLGSPYGGKAFANFGGGSGQIWLSNVRCPDWRQVNNIFDSCSHDGWGVHNCYHSEDVGCCCCLHPPTPLPAIIDACTTGRHNCAPDAVCSVDNQKTFDCKCRDGFAGSPTVNCTKYDVCAAGKHNCRQSDQVCVYNISSSGHTCRYRDVCSNGTHNCRGSNEVCVFDSKIGHTCTCAPGHTRESGKWYEQKPCVKLPIIPYSMLGQLQNDGTYVCPSWLQAANIGEALDAIGPQFTHPNQCRCTRHSLHYDYMVPARDISACVNRDGFSYQSAVLITCGVLLILLLGIPCFVWNRGSPFQRSCEYFFFILVLCGCLMIGFGARDRQCFSGVDECAMGTHACPPSFKCHDTECGYHCQCGDGTYETYGPSSSDGSDQYTCVDVNECRDLILNKCNNHKCKNTWGSYDCIYY